MVNQLSPRFAQFANQYASLVIIYYDYILTLPEEVKYVWKDRFRFSTVLYIFTRYAMLANLLYLLNLAGKVPNRSQVSLAIVILSVLGRASIFAIWTVRTWVVWARNRIILLILVPLLVAIVIMDIMATLMSKNKKVEDSLAIVMIIFEWAAVLLATYKCLRSRGAGAVMKGGVHETILKHGIIYIAAVSVLTLVPVILNSVAKGFAQRRLLNAYILPLSCTLTARFFLAMKALTSGESKVQNTDGTIHHETEKTIAFARPPLVSASTSGDTGDDMEMGELSKS